MTVATVAVPALVLGPQLQFDVEQFLYAEAAMLDERRIAEWIDLMCDDLRYHMPIRTNRGERDMAREYSGDGDVAYFDDSKASLENRLRKLESGQAWAENPPSRTRHIVSNVRVAHAEAAGELIVRSAFLVYRSRLERQVDIFAGERSDVLRPSLEGPPFRIARRTILLDQAVFLAANLSVFI